MAHHVIGLDSTAYAIDLNPGAVWKRDTKRPVINVAVVDAIVCCDFTAIVREDADVQIACGAAARYARAGVGYYSRITVVCCNAFGHTAVGPGPNAISTVE